jgi:hypothetical protein
LPIFGAWDKGEGSDLSALKANRQVA